MLSDIKKILHERGLHLNKKLGQHLLFDRNVLRKIVAACDPDDTDLIVEIGPGTGFLTEEFINVVGYGVVIEIDKGLVAYLHEKFYDTANMSIMHDDVLKCDLSHLCYQAVKKSQLFSLRRIKILGNLPYNISTPIIQQIAQSQMPLDVCVFVVQKELAERYTASPGSKSYGSSSILLQYRFAIEKLFSVSKQCFYPKPDVDSTAIRLVPHKKPPVEVMNEDLFFNIVRTTFRQRRKMLKNSLKTLEELKDQADDLEAMLARLKIPLSVRPEELSLEQFALLANALSS